QMFRLLARAAGPAARGRVVDVAFCPPCAKFGVRQRQFADQVGGVIVKHGFKHLPSLMSSSEFAANVRRTQDREERQMPLFMDVHNLEGGVSAADAAGAHEADLATQGAYGVNYLRYWVDEEAGKIFCLVDAPDAEAANTVHRQAHGLVADEIYPVTEHSYDALEPGHLPLTTLSARFATRPPPL